MLPADGQRLRPKHVGALINRLKKKSKKLVLDFMYGELAGSASSSLSDCRQMYVTAQEYCTVFAVHTPTVFQDWSSSATLNDLGILLSL
jgi:hypothetical protein